MGSNKIKNIRQWCEKNSGEEKQDGKHEWAYEFENGTEINKSGGTIGCYVLPPEHKNSKNHMKEWFATRNPEIKSDEIIKFGAESVKVEDGVLISLG